MLGPLSSLPIHDPASVSPKLRFDRQVKRGPSTPPADDQTAALRVDVPLVLVPVHVSTLLGTPVTNLGKGDFRVFEDNVEQTRRLCTTTMTECRLRDEGAPPRARGTDARGLQRVLTS